MWMKDSKKICAVVISNSAERSFDLYNRIRGIVDSFVFVTDRRKDFSWVRDVMPNIKIVQSRSSNFSYLRNLGIWVSSCQYVLRIDDDEVIDQRLADSLIKLDAANESYSVTVISSFSGKILNMWTSITPRIIRKYKAHYIGRLHEHLSCDFLSSIMIDGTITNDSYQSWQDYWKKALRYTQLEDKKLKLVLFRTIFPLYNYFSKSGFSDGILGSRVLMASFFTVF
jgi:hypothetical protein